MEIVFLIISIILTIVVVYAIGRTLYSHTDLIRAYKRSSFLVEIHSIMGIFMIFIFFIVLVACNNTFWHLPYLFN